VYRNCLYNAPAYGLLKLNYLFQDSEFKIFQLKSFLNEIINIGVEKFGKVRMGGAGEMYVSGT